MQTQLDRDFLRNVRKDLIAMGYTSWEIKRALREHIELMEGARR